MKKTLLTVCSILIIGMTHAQSLNPTAIVKSIVHKDKTGTGMNIMSIDTMFQYYQRATSFLIYSSTDGGYVYGPGAFDNQGTLVSISDATASHFDGVGNAVVTELLIWCGEKQIVGTADSIYGRVYSTLADSSANVMLGSTGLSTADLDTTGSLTSILINASITSSFLASIDYGGIDDTFGLVSSDPAMNDGAGEKRARQLTTATFGSAWGSVDDLYGGQLNCDVMIIPVVNSTGVLNIFNNELYTLNQVYPSPAKDFINLKYSLKSKATVGTVIFDSRGRILFSDKTENQFQGNHNKTIDVSSFASGKYYLTFNTGAKTLTQKFEIIK